MKKPVKNTPQALLNSFKNRQLILGRVSEEVVSMTLDLLLTTYVIRETEPSIISLHA